MWKVCQKDKQAKVRPIWEFGIMLGVRRRSGGFWIAGEKGEIKNARAVRRNPVENRWGVDSRRWVKHVLWHRFKGDEYADGEVPVAVEFEETLEEKKKGGGPSVVVKMRGVRPREV